MRVAEVTGMEGVGTGVSGLIWVWKSVEKSEADTQAMSSAKNEVEMS